MPLPRLYISDQLDPERLISLKADQTHYLSRVMRKRKGEEIELFNGTDGEWRGRITDIQRNKTEIRLLSQLRTQQDLHPLTLVFAPVQKHRNEYIVEKATELGVTHLQPIRTEFTDIIKLNEQRLRAISIEAAEQTKRICLPKLQTLCRLTTWLNSWPKKYAIYFADETTAQQGSDISDIRSIFRGSMKNLTKEQPHQIALLIGPQGGFSNEERELLLRRENLHRVNLGPRILRADTAAISLLTLWQSSSGDWFENSTTQ